MMHLMLLKDKKVSIWIAGTLLGMFRYDVRIHTRSTIDEGFDHNALPIFYTPLKEALFMLLWMKMSNK